MSSPMSSTRSDSSIARRMPAFSARLMGSVIGSGGRGIRHVGRLERHDAPSSNDASYSASHARCSSMSGCGSV